METALKERRMLHKSVNRLVEVVSNAKDDMKDTDIKLYIEKVEELNTDLKTGFREINQLSTTDEEFDKHEVIFNEYDKKLHDIKKILLEKHQQLTASIIHQPIPVTPATRTEVQLPKLDLPTFSGKSIEWTSFRDLYIASIHKNKSLSDAQKLQYLKSSLKGEAALIIQSIQITDANYNEAWSLINERYQNTREIINSHLERLLNQPSLHHESPTDLRRLVDTTNECVRALKVQGVPIEHWDIILIFTVTQKLDPDTKRQGELSQTNKVLPTFKKLTDFLDQRSRALAAACTAIAKPKGNPYHQKQVNKSIVVHHTTVEQTCELCTGLHNLNRCEKFLNMSVSERYSYVKRRDLCFNCLHGNHKLQQCKSGTCHKCHKYHHTLLHFEQQSKQDSDSIKSDNTSKSFSAHVQNNGQSNQVLLATAVINIRDKHGHKQTFRALLDSASQTSFVTERCAQQLGLHREKTNIQVIGVTGASMGNSRGCKKSQTIYRLQLKLADPQFFKSNKIDLLLGADIFAELFLKGRQQGEPGEPVALETTLGWIVVGKSKSTANPQQASFHVRCEVDNNANLNLQKFWELEQVPTIKPLTREEKQCKNHYEKTYERNQEGRFIVQLPFLSNVSQLGESREIAVRRLQQVERHLSKAPEKKNQYIAFIKEYVELGHAKVVPRNEINKAVNECCYLPHHAVMKEDSTTTKLRVVFDASAVTSTGISLNNTLMVGPKLQDDITSLLLRFRLHPIALSADIAKMYRQILVHNSHTDFQRIVWRENPEESVQDYKLLTVTYGTASGSYLAVKCLQQLAKEEKHKLPLAAEVILHDFFMDDLLSGAETEEDATKLQSDLTKLLKSGGFEIRKWASNSKQVLKSIPSELRATNLVQTISEDSKVKTLGVQWHPEEDYFSFTVTLPREQTRNTKRTLLSDMAKLYDPLGWLAPVVITVKLLFQSLWRNELQWDEQLPEHLEQQWEQYKQQIPFIKLIKIPRCIIPKNAKYFELHGYCDASELAYSAVVYLRTICDDNSICVRLVAAKTKVAPLKIVSIPRLELCGALLLADLIRAILNSQRVDVVHAWCDSTIALAWIKSHPARWKTFVANRVSAIQETIAPDKWHRVRSENNPADCASRGITVQALMNHELWWNGPEHLRNSISLENNTDSDQVDIQQEVNIEKKKEVQIFNTMIDKSFINKYSNFTRLYRVIAWCHRFASNLKQRNKTKGSYNALTINEINYAIKSLIKLVQSIDFNVEIQCLKSNKPLSINSKILSLHPFIDNEDILRVGGRLAEANLSSDQKNPILLANHNHFTKLLVEYEHKRLLHAGPQLLLNSLRRKYWILRGRDITRQVVKKCIICHKNRGETIKQLMGNLPIARVNPSKPFSTCGIGYAGPMSLKIQGSRVQKLYKAYIALFVCFATKAIHLEVVSNQTSEAFIAALKRFVSRRGIPNIIFTDCGTNFVGANHELQDCIRWLNLHEKSNDVKNYLSENGIEWKFNPPSAPHFGGLWEAGVKSMKYHLKRIVGNVTLNYEEFSTVLCQIEACLNSRPLTAISPDPNDLAALTPGHFLVGEPLTSIPERSWNDTKLNRLSRWQLLQKLNQEFWQRWSCEYLSRLQQIPKWFKSTENIKLGELVLVKKENQPPLQWKLARVIELHPGKDNLVRTVTLKTTNGIIKRPIVKLSPLPFQD